MFFIARNKCNGELQFSHSAPESKAHSVWNQLEDSFNLKMIKFPVLSSQEWASAAVETLRDVLLVLSEPELLPVTSLSILLLL